MKILVYENRKSDPIYFDASTPEKENEAFKKLFEILKEEWDVYADLEEEAAKPQQSGLFYDEKVQVTLYKKAITGDIEAIKKLMKKRQDYEYEEWRFGEVE